MTPITIQKVSQTRAHTVFHLGSDIEQFAIYCSPHVGHYLTEEGFPRPLTHTFLDRLFDALEITVRKVVLHKLEDGIYSARLFFEQGNKVVEIDARPSDCLPYALKNDIPLYSNR